MTAIDHIRLSQQAKDQLIKLKRVTGIEHWNVLCRWALCVSADRTAQDCDFPHGTITSHKTRHRHGLLSTGRRRNPGKPPESAHPM